MIQTKQGFIDRRFKENREWIAQVQAAWEKAKISWDGHRELDELGYWPYFFATRHDVVDNTIKKIEV